MSVVNTPEALVKCLTYLGEGPHWDDKKKLLYFVDINNSKVLWYNPENGKCDEAEVHRISLLFTACCLINVAC